MCPKCFENSGVVKCGYYPRKSDRKLIQRFFCRACNRGFSAQTRRIDYRFRKRRLDQAIFRGLCKGISQRGLAFLLGTKPATIARRIPRFGRISELHLRNMRSNTVANDIIIDEMVSFAHSKCKPLTMPLVVENGTRRIISLDVAQIPANGHLADISRKKYGRRPCRRHESLVRVFKEIKICVAPNAIIRSDESVHYPRHIRRNFPGATIVTSPGRRGCVVGQGELKRGGWDPLFSLNHTCAMFRDNLKRLSRRTWCTTKIPEMLRYLMMMYAWFHNLRLAGDRGILRTPINN